MAFTTPGTAVAGDVLTAAFWNSNVRDNSLELFNTMGLTHITTQSFTTASTVSINNCFSSSYSNYHVVIEHLSSEAAQTQAVRMRVAGADNTTASSYVRERLLSVNQVVTGNSTTSDMFNSLAPANTLTSTAMFIFTRPFEAVDTGILSVAGRSTSIGISAGNHNQATSYDGFSFIAGAGTMTGVIRVYGYRNG
jgi:hypothetical protein